jgi:8-oxo-dGTP pyrophosphatase MutT (NUDIX family)
VQNQAGEYLLIYRNGVWDLPKGKQEEGEDIALTALREVEEECGIGGLEQGELICITHHTYHMNGLHMLKDTYWYEMKYTGNSTLKPQLEEDIQKCEWVPAGKLAEYLQNTYPSIRKVFEMKGLV